MYNIGLFSGFSEIMKSSPENILPFEHSVSAQERTKQFGHAGGVFWLTGLSGAGKSTLAMNTESILVGSQIHCLILDGDNLRNGINKDLGFSPEDRKENIRRIAEMASLIAKAGSVCIVSLISPSRNDREMARQIVGTQFHEVYIDAGLSICESRDPKGLYAKARSGVIKEFTGISAPYEAPVQPDLILNTGSENVENCTSQLIAYIRHHINVVALHNRPAVIPSVV